MEIIELFCPTSPFAAPSGCLIKCAVLRPEFGGEIGGGQILMILTCAAGVRPCKNMTNVNAKPSLISQTAMTQAKSWVLWTNWNDFQLKLWCQRPGILSVQRGGGWTLSNFMLFNSADAWPVPLLVARHRHSLSSRKVLCGTPEEFIDGGAEVSLRKRKWVGRSIVSRWMEELLRWCLAPITILAGIRWIRVLLSR